jgi:hypothetical protein
MVLRISCGTIRSSIIVIGLVLGGCRGESAPAIEPPTRLGPAHDDAIVGSEVRDAATPDAVDPADDARQTSSDGRPESPAPEERSPPPVGTPLASDAIAASFRRWWVTFSRDQLASHPDREWLDQRVDATTTPRARSCDELAEHVRQRAPAGSPELLYGDASALEGRTDRCWWLHHDGMLDSGLGAALGSDGRVLAVWIVLEG